MSEQIRFLPQFLWPFKWPTPFLCARLPGPGSVHRQSSPSPWSLSQSCFGLWALSSRSSDPYNIEEDDRPRGTRCHGDQLEPVHPSLSCRPVPGNPASSTLCCKSPSASVPVEPLASEL